MNSGPPHHHPLLQFAKRATDSTAELARWVELDEVATVLLGSKSNTVAALGILDGAVTAWDGGRLFREGRQEHDRMKMIGGGIRMGLGVGGALPGMAGAACEGALGGYLVGEGLCNKDSETAAVGLTQMGVAAGMMLMSRQLGGSLGPGLILGGCLVRAGVLTYNRT